MTTTIPSIPPNAAILSVIILKHIKFENNQSTIEIVVDSETTNGLKSISLNEKYFKLFKSLSGQKNTYRLDTDIGDILTIDIIKNLRNTQWTLMTSHSFAHFSASNQANSNQKIIESDFYFERVASTSTASAPIQQLEDNSYLLPAISANSATVSRADLPAHTPHVVLANTALHPSPTHVPSSEQKAPDEKIKPSTVSTTSTAPATATAKAENASSHQNLSLASNSTSQYINQSANNPNKLDTKIDPQQISFVKPIVDTESRPKPVADPEVMAFILDKTGQTKGPYSFASRPTVAGVLSKSRKEMTVEDSVEAANASAMSAIEKSSGIERKSIDLSKTPALEPIPVRSSDYTSNSNSKPNSRNPSPAATRVSATAATTATSSTNKSVTTTASSATTSTFSKTPTSSNQDVKALAKAALSEDTPPPTPAANTKASSIAEKINALASKSSNRLEFVVTETSKSSNNLKAGLPPKSSSSNLLAKKESEPPASTPASGPPTETIPTPVAPVFVTVKEEVIKERKLSFSEKKDEILAPTATSERRPSRDFTAAAAVASATSTTASTTSPNTANSAAKPATAGGITIPPPINTSATTAPQNKPDESKSNTKSVTSKLFGSANSHTNEENQSNNNVAVTPSSATQDKTLKDKTLSSSSVTGNETNSTTTTPENKTVPVYRRASESINKLFNKYQPNKRKSITGKDEEATPSTSNAPTPTAAASSAAVANRKPSLNQLLQKDVTPITSSVVEEKHEQPATAIASTKPFSAAQPSTTTAKEIESIPAAPVIVPFKAKSADEVNHGKTAGLAIDIPVPQPSNTNSNNSNTKSETDSGTAKTPVEDAESPLTPSKTSFLENLKRISQTGASGPPPASERPVSTLGRKQLSMSSIDFNMNVGDDEDEFAFSGKPGLALKKKEEPVDEEHESSKTQHYSRLGSAFVSGNVLTRGRGGGRGGGRGRGL